MTRRKPECFHLDGRVSERWEKEGPPWPGGRWALEELSQRPLPTRREGLYLALRNTRHAFCPPKPKLLTRTLATGFCRAWLGT